MDVRLKFQDDVPVLFILCLKGALMSLVYFHLFKQSEKKNQNVILLSLQPTLYARAAVAAVVGHEYQEK